MPSAPGNMASPATSSTPEAIAAREPHLSGDFAGAVHFPPRASFPIPAGWQKPMRRCSAARAAAFLSAMPAPSNRIRRRWRVATNQGAVTAREVVVAMGPWSDQVFAPLGYAIPLQVKRGYHLHLKPRGNAVLHHPVLDSDLGYCLAPMSRGIRLTTGVEFADRDAPPRPVQVDEAVPRARNLFPLGDPVDANPWKGARPCLPDMLPVIGRAPRHPGLWFDFGHQHHGLTLGPATGRLLAEMMTGETPFADIEAFRGGTFWLTIPGKEAGMRRFRSLASGAPWRYCDKAATRSGAGHEGKRRDRLHAAGSPAVLRNSRRAPMQTAVMDKLQQQMISNIDKVSPEALMQSWFTFDPKIAERFQDMFVDHGRPGRQASRRQEEMMPLTAGEPARPTDFGRPASA